MSETAMPELVELLKVMIQRQDATNTALGETNAAVRSLAEEVRGTNARLDKLTDEVRSLKGQDERITRLETAVFVGPPKRPARRPAGRR